MALKFFNTLSRRKETFKPLKGKEVRMYTCGPTVYDYAHIGNFRAYVWEDILRRYLKYRGFRVKQVMNLTDVDDKTIKGAHAQGIPLQDFTSKYKKAFFGDIAKLNIEKAEIYPSATEHINEMVALIQKLLRKKIAYKGEDGSIYYNIKKFKNYGKLSKFRLRKLIAGKRVKQDEYAKEVASDFALWKAWDSADGDVFWETPLGKGRPGWHIECSAMSMKYLGETFDIHTGGIDNMFPHHENEIAQSEAATGKKFVKCWMHCRHLLVENKKMSKSLGNFYALRDLQNYDASAIRYLLLATHYRKELNFTLQGLEGAKNIINHFNETIRRLQNAAGKENKNMQKLIREIKAEFESAMDDDLDITKALSALSGFEKQINKAIDAGELSGNNAKEAIEFLRGIDSVLGIMKFESGELKLGAEVERLIEERENARKEKNFARADEIRAKLKELGYALDDTPEGAKARKIA
ncbi:MAG: cysteine--tRNA ligase [Candidatus Diapherotrites archaeon]|nr:cysteine--tRNA ligase [Candidatus Diapherotrites archaeon]